MTSDDVRTLARECGFELAGVAPAAPVADAVHYHAWLAAGYAGRMEYLAGHRARLRQDPRSLLPSARSVICVGKLYNSPQPYSTHFDEPGRAWISRYAWGDDYHAVLRRGLKRLEALLHRHAGPFDARIAVDTAPLLERSLARAAGLGWIGKNTCLIHAPHGSWFFLGEMLVSLAIAPDVPAPGRCGTCARCLEACPTGALAAPYKLDARRCIAYLTIELRDAIPEPWRRAAGRHVFGCDICQDVCPWNRRAPHTPDPAFAPAHFAPPLAELAALGEEEFRALFHPTPVRRARYTGFLRNVAVAMGNARRPEFRVPLERLAANPDPLVAAHAAWALDELT